MNEDILNSTICIHCVNFNITHCRHTSNYSCNAIAHVFDNMSSVDFVDKTTDKTYRVPIVEQCNRYKYNETEEDEL